MQKKVIVIKTNKIAGAFSGLLILMFLFFAADYAKTLVNAMPEAHPPAISANLYTALNIAPHTNTGKSETVTKMNNADFKNSNFESYNQSISYSDTINVYDTDSKVIKEMPLEDYVLCSLIAEMPQSFEADALMAQAVACRTFAVRQSIENTKHKNCDVCTDYRCCQSYIDTASIDFDITKAKEAVNTTKGIIAVFDGYPILAAYHSSSFGKTRSSKEVWGGEVEYLVSVYAPESSDVSAKNYNFSKNYTESTIAALGAGKDFEFMYDSSGICLGAKGNDGTVTQKQIKNALGLRSDSFSVTANGNEYIFTSYGYGHGVGMSQYGADALAKSGYSFYDILKHYYTGIEFDVII